MTGRESQSHPSRDSHSQTHDLERRTVDHPLKALIPAMINAGKHMTGNVMAVKIVTKRRSREHPRLQRAVGRPKIGAVMQAVASVTGTKVAELKAARGGPLRRLIAWIGWNESLVRLREIAKVLGLRSLGHISNEIRRSEREFADDPRMVDLVQQVFLALQH